MKESVRRSRSTSVRLGGLCEANGDAARTLVWNLRCASSLSRVADGATQENHFIATFFGCVINSSTRMQLNLNQTSQMKYLSSSY